MKTLLSLALSTLLSLNLYADPGTQQDLKVLYGAGQTVLDLSVFNAQVAVSAVIGAGRLSGANAPVFQGTLVQYGPDLQSFTYQAQPQDRLLVKFFNGQEMEFTYQDFRGDYTGDAHNFLSKSHALKCSAKHKDFQLQITSMMWNGNRQAEILGSAKHEGQNYQINLQVAGTYFSENDNSGSEFRSQFRMQGSIESDSRKIQVDESQDGRVITARERNGRYSSASSHSRTSNSVMNSGSNVYQMKNMKIQKAFKNGKPSDPDFWSATGGTLAKNGQDFVQFRAAYEMPYATIKALFSDGRSIDLEKFLIDKTL